MKYLANAPDYLREMHEKGQEGQARKLLGLLLNDQRMARVWTHLARKINRDCEWLRFWQEIKNAIHDASPKRKPKRAEEEADDLKWIAARADELARVIKIERRSVGYKGFFDFECHHFYPDDVMNFNGIHGWSSLTSVEQCAATSKVAWPTMAELLEGLSANALKQASEVVEKRVVLKDKGCWAETMFSRQLHSHLSQYPWERQDCIFATIATVANMASEAGFLKTKDNAGVTAKFVRKAIQQSS